MLWGLHCLVVLDFVLIFSTSYLLSHEPWLLLPLDLDSCCVTLKDDAEEACSICLCCPTSGEVVSTLPCGHIFHRACVHGWLRISPSCPFRCPLTNTAGEYGEAS